ncbi:MAG: hypothetical protein AAF799_25045 [Myxococcota bacterium]
MSSAVLRCWSSVAVVCVLALGCDREAAKPEPAKTAAKSDAKADAMSKEELDAKAAAVAEAKADADLKAEIKPEAKAETKAADSPLLKPVPTLRAGDEAGVDPAAVESLLGGAAPPVDPLPTEPRPEPKVEIASVSGSASARALLEGKRRQLVACYRAAVDKEPDLKGRFDFSFTLDGEQIRDVKTESGSESMIRCLRLKMRRWKLTGDDHAEVSVGLTLSL